MSTPSTPEKSLSIGQSEKGKKIFRIDSSLLKESDCEVKTHYIHDRGLTSVDSTYIMDYGTAFHHYAAGRYKGLPFKENLKKATERFFGSVIQVLEQDFRNIDHLIQTIYAYEKFYNPESDLKPLEINGVKAVELPFEIPYYVDKELEVLLCGTIDLVGYLNGELTIMDHKVTSVWNHSKYLQGFEMNIQTEFYSYVWKRYMEFPYYPPVVVNGIFIKPEVQKRKTESKSFGRQSTYSGANFHRSTPIEFSNERMDHFASWLEARVERIIKNWRDQSWKENHCRCVTLYGKCDYWNICRLNSKFREDHIREAYLTRNYDPINFQA